MADRKCTGNEFGNSAGFHLDQFSLRLLHTDLYINIVCLILCKGVGSITIWNTRSNKFIEACDTSLVILDRKHRVSVRSAQAVDFYRINFYR